MSVRWTGKLRPTVTGQYTLSFTSDDGCRLSIDGKMLIDAWPGHAVRTDTATIYLEAGKDYQLKAEYYDNRDYDVKGKTDMISASSDQQEFLQKSR